MMMSIHNITTEGAVNDFVTGTQLAFFSFEQVAQYTVFAGLICALFLLF
jgi:hypothetical protein